MDIFREASFPDTPFDVRDRTILLCRRGSEAHGLYVPSTDPNSIDDRDLLGVVVPPVRYYLGLSRWETAESIKGVWDVVLYEIRHFVRMLVKQNPNALSVLWLEPEDYLYLTPAGEALIKARDLFRARTPAAAAFIGYAHGQLKKMTTGAFRGYMGEKRKGLVEKYGYDTKNAAHCIRLLHMGIEYMQTGRLEVRRTWDQPKLLSIKRGGYELEEIQAYAEQQLENFRNAESNSKLPETIDLDAVEALTTACIREAWSDAACLPPTVNP